MTEEQQAERIANLWLDMVMNPLVQMVAGDPDCDACILARQFIRMKERAERAEAERDALREHEDKLLRAVVDEAWGEALEDGSVPSTKLQDKVIAKARTVLATWPAAAPVGRER